MTGRSQLIGVLQALGTHNGMVHILTYEGSKVNSSRPHGASITSLWLDEENDFVATASVEGQCSVVYRMSDIS